MTNALKDGEQADWRGIGSAACDITRNFRLKAQKYRERPKCYDSQCNQQYRFRHHDDERHRLSPSRASLRAFPFSFLNPRLLIIALSAPLKVTKRFS